MTETAPGKVLIVDDDEGLLRACERVLKGAGYTPISTPSPGNVMSIIRKEMPDVLLLDVKLGSASGLDVLKDIKEKTPDVEVIMMTAYATLDLAIEAVKAGAYDFLTKPFESNDKLILAIQNALEKRHLVARAQELEREVEEKYCFDSIIGKSLPMQEVFRTIRDISRFDLNVLIQGQSGTGKELVAKAIHYSSRRKQTPFVAINCAALTESLIESELFGHERGAFTGAIEKKKGLFEAATGGTIFLDEIGEMPLPLQSKLLRVLETGEMRRVGGIETLRVNVRVIAATNKELEKEIATGRFREDLYYRLNVISVTLPPLKDRSEDISLLVRRFVGASSKKTGKKAMKVPSRTMEALVTYPWPGNVRELENAIERAVVLAPGDEIRVEDLPHAVRAIAMSSPAPPGAPSSPIPDLRSEAAAPAREIAGGSLGRTPDQPSNGSPEPSDPQADGALPRIVPMETNMNYQELKERTIQEFDKTYLALLLKKSGGNISLASHLAGMDRSNLKRLLKKSGLRTQGA